MTFEPAPLAGNACPSRQKPCKMSPGLPHCLPVPMHDTQPQPLPLPGTWTLPTPVPAPPQPSLARASPDHTPMKPALGRGWGWGQGLNFISAAGTAVPAAARACCNQPRVRSPRQELLGRGTAVPPPHSQVSEWARSRWPGWVPHGPGGWWCWRGYAQPLCVPKPSTEKAARCFLSSSRIFSSSESGSSGLLYSSSSVSEAARSPPEPPARCEDEEGSRALFFLHLVRRFWNQTCRPMGPALLVATLPCPRATRPTGPMLTFTWDSVMPREYASRARSGPARYLVCSKVFSRAKIWCPVKVGRVCFFLCRLSAR